MMIHSRLSTWMGVLSILISAFTSLPAGVNHYILAFNILLMVAIIWRARHEGKQVYKQSHPPTSE